MHLYATCALSLLALLPPVARAEGDARRGEDIYQSRCGACHSLDYDGVGPAHRGVFGRIAGTAPGYVYSAALTSSHVIWTASTLDRWLENPEKLIPGQKMGYSVPESRDRADVIAYLKGQQAASR